MKKTRIIATTVRARNENAWAIGYRDVMRSGFHIRRVVWGRLLAREEKRDGETIRRVVILITGKPS